jgi:hypothetical protein
MTTATREQLAGYQRKRRARLKAENGCLWCGKPTDEKPQRLIKTESHRRFYRLCPKCREVRREQRGAEK